jgi:hypothetical protein
MSTKQASIQCPPGLRISTANAVYGVLSSNINQATHCHQRSVDQELEHPISDNGVAK